jgi:anaerobic magnesium-protoporphyrin IX monomethyl ester cyclase
MKLVLTSLDTGREGHPPLGLGYIASYLREYLNFDSIAIVDKEDDLFKTIKKHKPEIVGISSVTNKFNRAVKLSDRIKEELQIPVILGGCHITSAPYSLPKSAIGVMGEGEQTMLELVKIFNKYGSLPKSELKKTAGVVFWNNNHIAFTRRRKLIRPLDTIPFPARDLFKMDYYLKLRTSVAVKKLSRGTSIITSRGCPFRCVYCAVSKIWNNTIRQNTSDYVIREIQELIDKYEVNGICIFDDFFTFNTKRLRKIADLIKKKGIDIEFRCSSRVDFISEESAKLLKKINVTSVALGFESGSDRILGYLKRNTITMEQNIKAVKLLKKHGIAIHGYFILGSPTETREDMFKTLENSSIDSVSFGILTPYPGTELWEYAKQRGLVSNDMDWDMLYHKPNSDDFVFLNSETMTKEEFWELYNSFLKRTEKKRYGLDFKTSDLSMDLLKRALKPDKWKYIYYSVRKKLRS